MSSCFQLKSSYRDRIRNHMLHSPWITYFTKIWFGMVIEKAMNIFVIGMESIPSTLIKRDDSSIDNLFWFFSQFPTMYIALTSTGLGGPNTFQAASMLLRLPIPTAPSTPVYSYPSSSNSIIEQEDDVFTNNTWLQKQKSTKESPLSNIA
jgi:hypothetical protein